MIWCTNPPNVHIQIFCKCWSFIWGCFFPVTIFNCGLLTGASHNQCISNFVSPKHYTLTIIIVTTPDYLIHIRQVVGNKAKGRISKRVFQEKKACRIFRKTNISYSLIRTRGASKGFMKALKVKGLKGLKGLENLRKSYSSAQRLLSRFSPTFWNFLRIKTNPWIWSIPLT